MIVIEEDSLSCKGEEVYKENGKNLIVIKFWFGSIFIE